MYRLIYKMKKTGKIVLLLIFVAWATFMLPRPSVAQNDHFFKYEDVYSRSGEVYYNLSNQTFGDDGGYNLNNQHFGDAAPLGDGILIMIVASLGYAFSKRRKKSFNF